MTCNFNSDFGTMVDTVQHMLEMSAQDLKLKKDFQVRVISFIVSRYPQHYELYVELDDHKQYTQLWKKDGVHIVPQSAFVPVLPSGGK